jgi:polar amino acid transport system ATP-binding protein
VAENSVLSISSVEKCFDDKNVVDGISFEVEEGDLIALIGPSGCGKSTLLRCINGLETLDSGAIRVFNTTLKSISEIGEKNFADRAQVVRQKTGMVFQSFNLFPHLTILQNMMKAPQVVLKQDSETAEKTSLGLLKKVGLDGKENHFPSQLSGGQQQRVAIARALAMAPKIMLYDEPTSALDPTLVDEVLKVMKQLDAEGMTQIVVTHEMRFARDVADRIAYIEHGQIVEMGPPEQIFSNPRDERTRNFLRHFL